VSVLAGLLHTDCTFGSVQTARARGLCSLPQTARRPPRQTGAASLCAHARGLPNLGFLASVLTARARGLCSFPPPARARPCGGGGAEGAGLHTRTVYGKPTVSTKRGERRRCEPLVVCLDVLIFRMSFLN
jgi:hypothetical protein